VAAQRGPGVRKRRGNSRGWPVGQTAGDFAFRAAIERHIGKADAARKLACDEKEVRRMLDPRHPTKLPRIKVIRIRNGVGFPSLRRLCMHFVSALDLRAPRCAAWIRFQVPGQPRLPLDFLAIN